MQTIKALREFEYNGKKYLKGTSYTVHDTVAEYLIYRNLAVLVSVEPDTNVMQGETKELKKETVKKPFPVSKRK